MLFDMETLIGATFSNIQVLSESLKPPFEEDDMNFCHAEDNGYCLVIA